MSDKIKVLQISNFSKAKTGFGNAARNILKYFHKDPDIEIIEAANGASFNAELNTPWKSYGTYPSDLSVLQEVKSDPRKDRLAQYGNFVIDEIIKKEKPDIILGVEDIWAFDWAKKVWFDKLKTVIWTTLDSLPILDQAEHLCPKVDKFLVWASFAEEAMKKDGYDVETLHGTIDYSSFKSLTQEEKLNLRAKNGVASNFLIGFVFKNQLRKSVPNLLEGFKIFKEKNPEAKLLLHTDWPHADNTWDIQRFIKEKNIDSNDVLATYICKKCKNYFFSPYQGEDINCPNCGAEKQAATKSNVFGVTEEQLNEIYNMMDVYCHPFTSGGQELPVQEAKSAGLITLVTEYSCGTDSCYEHQGGIPLKWEEYREPQTQFIKATTLPSSIAESLQRVKDMSLEEKEKIVKAGQEWVQNEFSIERTAARLKEIFLELGKTDWDFSFEEKKPDPSFVIEVNKDINNVEWLKEVYKGIFNKDFSDNDVEIKKGEELVEKNGREAVLNHLRGVAINKVREIESKDRKLEDYFEGEDEKRIAVVIPESAGDVLWVNSLISNLKKKHPDYNIYVVTKPEYFCMIEDHPDVKNLIPYQQGMNNLLFWEGKGEWKGYVDIAYMPFIGTQVALDYLHNDLS